MKLPIEAAFCLNEAANRLHKAAELLSGDLRDIVIEMADGIDFIIDEAEDEQA